jgi:hypothetical protein
MDATVVTTKKRGCVDPIKGTQQLVGNKNHKVAIWRDPTSKLDKRGQPTLFIYFCVNGKKTKKKKKNTKKKKKVCEGK